jgi:hypothetical protein
LPTHDCLSVERLGLLFKRMPKCVAQHSLLHQYFVENICSYKIIKVNWFYKSKLSDRSSAPFRLDNRDSTAISLVAVTVRTWRIQCDRFYTMILHWRARQNDFDSTRSQSDRNLTIYLWEAEDIYDEQTPVFDPLTLQFEVLLAMRPVNFLCRLSFYL